MIGPVSIREFGGKRKVFLFGWVCCERYPQETAVLQFSPARLCCRCPDLDFPLRWKGEISQSWSCSIPELNWYHGFDEGSKRTTCKLEALECFLTIFNNDFLAEKPIPWSLQGRFSLPKERLAFLYKAARGFKARFLWSADVHQGPFGTNLTLTAA